MHGKKKKKRKKRMTGPQHLFRYSSSKSDRWFLRRGSLNPRRRRLHRFPGNGGHGASAQAQENEHGCAHAHFYGCSGGESACASRRNAHRMGRSAVIKMLRTKRAVRLSKLPFFLRQINSTAAARSSSFHGRFRWKSSPRPGLLRRCSLKKK